MKILAVDVDGVLADVHTTWLARYNHDYHDNLTKEQWTTWNIEKLVKPECGKKIFKYIEDPSIYDDTLPIDGALERINVLKRSYRVIFVTTSTLGASGKKFLWLKQHGFLTKQEDYVECKDKSLVYSQYLIDDDIKNIVKPVPYDNRINILFTEPWNKDFMWVYRMDDWESFFDFR